MFCPNLQCEAVIPPQARYCPQCGEALHAEQPAVREQKAAGAVWPPAIRASVIRTFATQAPVTRAPTIRPPASAPPITRPSAGRAAAAPPVFSPPTRTSANDFLILDDGRRWPDVETIGYVAAYVLAAAGTAVLLMALIRLLPGVA